MATKPLPKEAEPKPLPQEGMTEKELPMKGNPENCVTIAGEVIEIKPTKLKYQRNKSAAFYRALAIYPLPDIFAMDKGVLDENKDGDKLVYDWCVAVLDDYQFVHDHFDDMDYEVINRMLEIFKRLNGIDEKEEQAKNRMAKETKS